MPNLSTTTLRAPAGLTAKTSQNRFQLASTANVSVGQFLVFAVGARAIEAMQVIEVVSPFVRVLRAQAGTPCSSHAYDTLIYIGTPDKFRSFDPHGVPVVGRDSPWINLRSGAIFAVVGDEAGPNVAARFWQQQTVTYPSGALGERVAPTLTP